MTFLRWSRAMAEALYGRDGFYLGQPPAAHFRTSAQSPTFAAAIAELVRRTDSRLGNPPRFDLVDVGAGAGELLAEVLRHEDLGGRLAPLAVELRPRPEGLDERIAWVTGSPAGTGFTGLLLACELLDNVPCDVAVLDGAGVARYEEVEPDTGDTRLAEPLGHKDSTWMRRWWPLVGSGDRAEIGRERDDRWRGLCASLRVGTALAIDYGHTRENRPAAGTLTGYAGGRQVAPIPDGSRDLTAHVAFDSLGPGRIVAQREALRELGIGARRPPLTLAHTDPAAYVRALGRAGEAAELLDPAALGAHLWLTRDVGG